MNFVVKNNPSLYELDSKQEGFQWIDGDNSEYSVFSFIRYAKDPEDFVIVILNMTPLVHNHFEIGVPVQGKYFEVINSDKGIYGGSNLFNGKDIFSESKPVNGFDHSIDVVLSPLSITILKRGD